MKKWSTAKLCKVMKICAAQMMIVVIVCGVSAAHDNYAQILERKVTLEINNVALETALKELEAAASIKIFYSSDQLGFRDSVSIHAKDQELKEVLDGFLSAYDVMYKVDERKQAIFLKRGRSDEEKDLSVARPHQQGNLLRISIMNIGGTVTDATTQQVLAGVNVVVKGTTTGTTTDAEGKYSIQVEENSMLVFSFIGYATTELSVGNRTVIDVSMKEDVTSLGEVVVNAGYWNVKEKEQTGNISRITAEEIQQQPVGNPLSAMQGRMAGVYIQQSSGIPGGSFTIEIRGRNSLRSNGNDPLYVIDGVPFTSTPLGSISSNLATTGGSPLNNLNPSDIESIEILKDADATSIYGSRGSNGVILITTKKGKAGKTRFNANVYSGIGKASNSLQLMDTEKYLSMRHEAFRNDNMPMTVTDAPDLLVWDTTRYTDWQEDLIGGTANIVNAQASISGGSQDTQFLFATGFYKESTVFPGSFHDQKFSSNLNVTHTAPSRKFHFTVSSSIVLDNNQLPYQDPTASAMILPPNAPQAYDTAGNLNWETGYENPYASLMRKLQTNTTNVIGNSTLNYEIINGLTAKVNLGYNLINMKETATMPIAANDPANGLQTGISTFSSRRISTWIAEPQLEYKIKLGPGQLTSLVGSTFQSTTRQGETLFGFGFSSDALLENMSAATTLLALSADNSEYKYVGLFGRIYYNLLERYLINVTARRDGSSRFGPGNRFGNFGAVGLAWIFSKEALFSRGKNWLSFGKLRASYGSTGSDQIGDYEYLDTYSSSAYPYLGVSGLIPTRLANADYGWEVNRKFEVGAEFGFFKDKIQFTVSRYLNRSSNQLVGYSLPITTGFTTMQYNLPATVQNDGWELVLGTTVGQPEKFSWSASVNATFPSNTLLSYPNIEGSPYANTYEVGKSLYITRAFRAAGVSSEEGYYTYADNDDNGSGVDYPADVQTLGEKSQKMFGGLNNTFRLGNFSIDLFVQFVKQNGESYYGYLPAPGMQGNQLQHVLNRWRAPGDATSVQKFTSSYSTPAGEAYSYASFSDYNLVDASFVRLKNVSISWQVPGQWRSKIGLQECRIYLLGQNLLTFTDYDGLDPENQSITRLPPLRTVVAGIQFTL
ncbi:MAG TPA: SusC/RagA family TonB-linked outer membrane protein [Chryseolinea sp.]|nr:SusC/RagA family TonB-linked outer membrane protein [Chryseolinea sp.]